MTFKRVSKRRLRLSDVVLGPNGVRAGWRFLAYVLLLIGLVVTLQTFLLPPVMNALHVPEGLTAYGMLASEIVEGIGVFGATAVLAALERRRIDSYGLPVRAAFGGRFWEGIAIGVVAAGAVAIAMLASGAMVVHGLALQAGALPMQAVLWLIVMVLVGVNEEYMFRGYPLATLARGMGFWPAAILLSLLFGAAHLTKPGENLIDITNIVLLGLLLCLTLLRTGTLWLAVGFHCSFDYMQFFVIGTRNGGEQPVGRLLDATFPGPAWANGGALGTEASYFMLPVIALIFVYVLLRFRKPAAA
jgi:membrane protease YdiL (CAAX protease family)